MLSLLSKKRNAPPHAWCYASGRVAALEGELLARPAFEALLRCRNASEARSMLAKTAYKSVFHSDAECANYAAALECYCFAAQADLLKSCPPHVLGRAFELEARYRASRTLFLRRAAKNAAPAELDECLLLLAAGSVSEEAALAAHRAKLLAKEPPQTADAVARSIFLDSAACAVALAIAQAAPEELVRRYLLDEAYLGAWASILRSRRNGAQAGAFTHWFLLGEANKPFVEKAATLPFANIIEAVAPLLSREAAHILSGATQGVIETSLDSLIAEALRETARNCRYTPFGPEKVLSYLAALRVERLNLQLCLAAIMSGIDREAAQSRLRKEYA